MQENGSLLIKIGAVSDWGVYAFGLIIVSLFFVFGLWIFAPALFKARTLTELLYFLLPVTFLLLWFMIGLRIILESLCSVELSVGKETFRWKYQLWRWCRQLEVRQGDATAVITKARWHENRLKVTMTGKTYSLGDLLDEDIDIVARELRRTLPEASLGRPVQRF